MKISLDNNSGQGGVIGMQPTPWTITGRWIIPMEGPPLERARIIIRGDRIIAVEAFGNYAADVDVGNAAILPGLVNAHTHLDLSGSRGQIRPSADFTEWLRAVIRHRRSLTLEEVQRDVRAGL